MMRCGCIARSAEHRLILDYTTILCGVKDYVPVSPHNTALRRNMIPILGEIVLDDSRIAESFIRASGPGGQNVNKVASAVQLRVDLAAVMGLGAEARERLMRLAGRRLGQGSVLVITARRFRSQERNRQDALERLVALIRRAALVPTPRRPSRPSIAAKERRLAAKTHRAALKEQRRSGHDPDDGR
jgi:ribosome-associated protein